MHFMYYLWLCHLCLPLFIRLAYIATWQLWILILSSLDPLLGEPSLVVYYLHNTLTLDPLLVPT